MAPPADVAPPVVVKAKRKPNQWIQHVSAWRKDNADKIKAEKLSCGAISKMARATYAPRARCATCGK